MQWSCCPTGLIRPTVTSSIEHLIISLGWEQGSRYNHKVVNYKVDLLPWGYSTVIIWLINHWVVNWLKQWQTYQPFLTINGCMRFAVVLHARCASTSATFLIQFGSHMEPPWPSHHTSGLRLGVSTDPGQQVSMAVTHPAHGEHPRVGHWGKVHSWAVWWSYCVRRLFS